jgi:hypothetical protein
MSPAAYACRGEVFQYAPFFPPRVAQIFEATLKRGKTNKTWENIMNSKIQKKLEQIAYKRSRPFCYSCYQEAPAGKCECCGSDDLMRLSEVGCEYGTEHVIRHILETELTAVDLEEAFEQSVRDCYPETTKVAWCEFDTVTLLKSQDPISWKCALSEYESNEESEGNIISFDGGSAYYFTQDIEAFVEEET